MRTAMLSVTIVLICSARMAWAQLEPSCVKTARGVVQPDDRDEQPLIERPASRWSGCV